MQPGVVFALYQGTKVPSVRGTEGRCVYPSTRIAVLPLPNFTWEGANVGLDSSPIVDCVVTTEY